MVFDLKKHWDNLDREDKENLQVLLASMLLVGLAASLYPRAIEAFLRNSWHIMGPISLILLIVLVVKIGIKFFRAVR